VNDNEDQSWLTALDKKTGKTIWESEARGKDQLGHAICWESGKRTEIITPGKNRVRSYDMDGKFTVGVWRHVIADNPNAVHAFRIAVCQLGLCR